MDFDKLKNDLKQSGEFAKNARDNASQAIASALQKMPESVKDQFAPELRELMKAAFEGDQERAMQISASLKKKAEKYEKQ